MDKQTEHNLIRQWQERRDYDARDQVVLAIMPLIKQRAGKRCYMTPHHYYDLLSVGSEAAFKAIDKFELERGHRFSSLLVWELRGAFTNYYRRLEYLTRHAACIDNMGAVPDPQVRHDAIHQEQQREHLARSIAKLSKRQREAIMGVYFKGQTQVNVAADAGISASAIKAYHATAIKRLKADLGHMQDALI